MYMKHMSYMSVDNNRSFLDLQPFSKCPFLSIYIWILVRMYKCVYLSQTISYLLKFFDCPMASRRLTKLARWCKHATITVFSKCTTVVPRRSFVHVYEIRRIIIHVGINWSDYFQGKPFPQLDKKLLKRWF